MIWENCFLGIYFFLNNFYSRLEIFVNWALLLFINSVDLFEMYDIEVKVSGLIMKSEGLVLVWIINVGLQSNIIEFPGTFVVHLGLNPTLPLHTTRLGNNTPKYVSLSTFFHSISNLLSQIANTFNHMRNIFFYYYKKKSPLVCCRSTLRKWKNLVVACSNEYGWFKHSHK